MRSDDERPLVFWPCSMPIMWHYLFWPRARRELSFPFYTPIFTTVPPQCYTTEKHHDTPTKPAIRYTKRFLEGGIPHLNRELFRRFGVPKGIGRRILVVGRRKVRQENGARHGAGAEPHSRQITAEKGPEHMSYYANRAELPIL
jgi:hypothetical protein